MQTIRSELSRSGGGNANDPNWIAARVWERHNGTGGITYADARTAALRAIRGREVGRQIAANPGGAGAPLARDYPIGDHFSRSRGNYEYRTVVRGDNGTANFEAQVFVYSRTRLDGDEIVARARRMFMRGEGAYLDYQTQVRGLGAIPPPDVFILFASHNPAGSTGR